MHAAIIFKCYNCFIFKSTLQVENAENKGKITAYETQINNLKEQLKFEQDKTNSDAQTICSN